MIQHDETSGWIQEVVTDALNHPAAQDYTMFVIATGRKSENSKSSSTIAAGSSATNFRDLCHLTQAAVTALVRVLNDNPVFTVPLSTAKDLVTSMVNLAVNQLSKNDDNP